MKRTIFCSKSVRTVAAGSLLAAAVFPCAAATRDVPTDFASIQLAIAASSTGDEIRVRSDYTETGNTLDVTGLNLTIRSYNSSFTAPEAGARWESTSGSPAATNYLLRITTASVAVEGFANISFGAGGSAFLLASDSALSVTDSSLTGMTLSNSSAIKTDTSAVNVATTLTNCIFTGNGRSIWYNSASGTCPLTIDGCSFTGNTSYNIEFRVLGGTHSLNATDTSFVATTNHPFRLYFFGVTDGVTDTINTVNFNRCLMDYSALGRGPIVVGGIESTSGPGSSLTINATNCVMDLRNAADSTSTVAVTTLVETTRRSDLNLRHCTIVTGTANMTAVRLLTPNSTWNVQNCIFDGPGPALKNEGGGILNSAVNLINMTPVSDGNATLSGNEIVGSDPLFVDRTNGDFSLTALSPAVAAGADLGITVDIDGNPRPNPVASNPDLGAYEILGSAGVAEWSA